MGTPTVLSNKRLLLPIQLEGGVFCCSTRLVSRPFIYRFLGALLLFTASGPLLDLPAFGAFVSFGAFVKGSNGAFVSFGAFVPSFGAFVAFGALDDFNVRVLGALLLFTASGPLLDLPAFGAFVSFGAFGAFV